MNESTKVDTIKVQLEEELAKWQTKIDEARVQLNLGSKDAEDKLRPYINQLDNEMSQAKEKWAQMEEASENSWEDIKQGLDTSVDAMNEAFSQAKKHFSSDKTS